MDDEPPSQAGFTFEDGGDSSQAFQFEASQADGGTQPGGYDFEASQADAPAGGYAFEASQAVLEVARLPRARRLQNQRPPQNRVRLRASQECARAYQERSRSLGLRERAYQVRSCHV